jgi:ribose transport system substrate-binding protein
VPFVSPETKLPSSYPTPKVKKGQPFKVAYLEPLVGVPILDEQAAAITAEAKSLGGSVIIKNNQLQPTLELSNFNQALAQNVNAIVLFPLDPQALAPAIAKARKQGVAVVAIDDPPDAGQAPTPGLVANALTGRDHNAYLVAKAVAEKDPGSSFSVLGLAQPIPTLSFSAARLTYWATKFGLKSVGPPIDSQANTAQGYAQATASLLSKYPTVQTLFTTTDIASVAAVGQRVVSGKPDLRIVGVIGEPEGLKAVAAGNIFAETKGADAAAAKEATIAAYLFLTKQDAKLPPEVAGHGTLVTK